MPYYLCDMVATSGEDGPDGSGRRPRVAIELGVWCDAVSCRDLEWCVARAPVAVTPAANILPLNNTVISTLTLAQRAAYADFLDTYSVPRGWIEPTMTTAEVGRRLARYIAAVYRLTNNGEISIRAGLQEAFSSLPAARRQAIREWFSRLGLTVDDLDDAATLATIIGRIAQQYRLRVRLGGEELVP